VLDLSDACFLSPTKIKIGNYKEAGQCDVIVITAGAKQKPGESRNDLLLRNTAILRSVFQSMTPVKPEAVVIIVSNPVDVLTNVAQQLSGLPRSQVFGSGTFLDSMRLRTHLSGLLGVNGSSIHSYVLGEHGDLQFVHWSQSRIAGTPLEQFGSVDCVAVERAVMRKAYDIIECKGATSYGIGTCVAKLLQNVVHDEKEVRCVSAYADSFGVSMSVPVVLGRNGVERLVPLELSSEELAKMQVAVDAIKGGVAACFGKDK